MRILKSRERAGPWGPALLFALLLAGALPAQSESPPLPEEDEVEPLVPDAEGRGVLQLRSTEAPEDYWVRMEIQRTTSGGKGDVKREKTDHLDLLEVSLDDAGDGNLEVLIRPLGREDVLADRPDEEGGFLDPYTYRIEPSGKRVGKVQDESAPPGTPSRRTDLARGLWPVLPTEPIATGHSWETVLDSAEDLPAPLTVRHRFTGIEEVQGTPCAIVETEGDAKGTVEASGVRYAVQLEQGLALSLEDGTLVKLSTVLRIKQAAPARAGKPERKAQKTVDFIVQRREAGDVPGETLPDAGDLRFDQPASSEAPEPDLEDE